MVVLAVHPTIRVRNPWMLIRFLGGKFKDGKAVNRQFKSFFLGLGTSEPTPFPGVVKAFRQMLDKQGIKYTYYESPETAHEWLTWRRALHQYAQLLFQ